MVYIEYLLYDCNFMEQVSFYIKGINLTNINIKETILKILFLL